MINITRFFAAVIAVWVVGENLLIAQGNEPSAEVEVRNVVVLPPRHVEFDLVLTNRSFSAQTAWRTWANGTFFFDNNQSQSCRSYAKCGFLRLAA